MDYRHTAWDDEVAMQASDLRGRHFFIATPPRPVFLRYCGVKRTGIVCGVYPLEPRAWCSSRDDELELASLRHFAIKHYVSRDYGFYQAVRHLRLHLHIHRHAEVSRILRFGYSPPRRRRGAVAGLGTVWRNWLDWGYDLRVWLCMCQAECTFFHSHYDLQKLIRSQGTTVACCIS